MNASDDWDLRERFKASREEDLASTPPLSRVLAGRTVLPPARPTRWIPVAGLAVAASLTAAMLVIAPRQVQPSIDDAIGQAQEISSWTAPTDAWLTLSGLEIPDSVLSLTPSSVTLPELSTAATPQGDPR